MPLEVALGEQPQPPSQKTEMEIPDDLEAIILACLAKSRDDRPASAMELEERLSRCRDANSWNQQQAERWWHLHRSE